MSDRFHIVIPFFDKNESLSPLLTSLCQFGIDGENVTVVSSGPECNVISLRDQFDFRLIRRKGRLNPSAARNLGARSVKADYLAFLDSDTIVTDVWVSALTEISESKGVVLTGDTVHISKNPNWLENYWFSSHQGLTRNYINGANIIISTALFEELGGFNEELETGEDYDLSIRAEKLGVAPRLDSRFYVFHEGYPGSLREFFKREKWHAAGDLVDVKSFLSSRVMLASFIYLIGLIICLIAAFFLEATVFFVFLAAVIIYTTMLTLYKFGVNARGFFLKTIIMNVYLAGRAMALVEASLKPFYIRFTQQ